MAIINDLPCVSGLGLTKELLWTNSNPTQSFGNTKVTITDITNYDYIMFETAICPSSALIPDKYYQTLCKVSDIVTKVGGYYGRPLMLSCVYSVSASSLVTFQRLVVWDSLTVANFQSCTQFNTSSVNNYINVPLRIYGVKGEIN